MSSSELVTYELDGAVAVIGLNRPDKRNAINNDVVMQLRDAVVRGGDEADCWRDLRPRRELLGRSGSRGAPEEHGSRDAKAA